MDNKVNYTVIGFFVVILMAATIIFVLWLTSVRHSKVYVTYVTYMHEEVSGLSEQSSVLYNGVKVGYVSEITLNPKDPQQVKIVLQLESGTPVSTSTVAILSSQGLTGVDFVGLKALSADAPLLERRPGQKYPVIPSEPSLLVKLSTSLQEVTTSVNELSKDISKVFDEKNRQSIANSLASVDKITKNLADHSQEITDSIHSANQLLNNAENASRQLPLAINQFQAAMTSIKTAANAFEKTGDETSMTMRDARGTLQAISQQLLPSAEEMLSNFNSMSRRLNHLSLELNDNPSILVRGKYPSRPGPGEQ